MSMNNYEKRQLKDLDRAVNDVLSDWLPAHMGKPDWEYRDLPRMTPEFFAKFVDLVGEDNILWITKASYKDGTQRGQLLVSPEGLKRARAYSEGKNHVD